MGRDEDSGLDLGWKMMDSGTEKVERKEKGILSHLS